MDRIFFPNLDKEMFQMLTFDEKKKYLSEELEKVYREQETLLNQKVEDYNRHWNRHKSQIEDALSNAF